MNAVKQSLFIIVAAAICSLGLNLVLPNNIEFVGKWRSLSTGDDPILPPTSEEGDAPFISLDVAQMEHSTGRTFFIDARDPTEFECGTIPGSVNIPFDYLPEGDLPPYFDSALSLPLDYPMVIFCSGDDCDLSLHLARNMQESGYSALLIFFGGAREWEKFGLEMERRTDCEE